MTLRHYRVLFEQVFGETTFDQYFKFTFVRNPWDRVYSAYTFLLAGGFLRQDRRYADESVRLYPSFGEFVLNWLRPDNIYRVPHFIPQLYYLIDTDGSIGVDFIGRFETLEKDYEALRRKIGFGKPLEKKNVTTRKETSYIEAYDEQTKQRIAEVYADDIVRLGYSFEDGSDAAD